MKKANLLKKVDNDEGLTVKEIKAYQKMKAFEKNIYGKYGALKKEYLENFFPAKLLELKGDLAQYLHNIDIEADKMYDEMYENLSLKDKYEKTGNAIEDLQKSVEMDILIDEVIIKELIYNEV